MKPQQFQIPVDIFKRNILVCINEPNEEIERILVESGHDETEAKKAAGYDSDSIGAYAWIFENRNALIRLKGEKVDPIFHDCVAHEIAHVAFAILDYVGIKLGSKSEEAYAYLIGYITREFYEKIEL